VAREARHEHTHPCLTGVYMNGELMGATLEILPGRERILVAQFGEDYLKSQLCLDKMQRVSWIQGLANWEVMSTGTFRWHASGESARRIFEKWMARKLPQVSYYYAVERNPSRDGYHVHSLWSDCRGVFRKDAWCDWFGRYGRARIEPVRRVEDVSDYASKYLCKEDGWWNVKLQWHWLQRIRGGEFKLRSEISEV